MPTGSGCLAARPTAARTVRPVAVSTVLRPVLQGGDRDAESGAGSVLAVFPTALYVQVGGQVLAVVAADGLRLPIAAVLAEPSAARPFAAHRSGDQVTLHGGALQVGPVRYVPGRWWSAAPVRPGRPDAAAVRELGAALTASAPEHDPAVERTLAAAAVEIRSALGSGDDERAAAAADAVLGLGPGLTPSGDDLLAGLLVTCHGLRGAGDRLPGAEALGRHVARCARSRTPALSAALLRCAASGLAAPPVLDLVDAVAGRRALAPALRALLAVGHTSGHDTARGVQLAAQVLLDRSPDDTGAPLPGAPTEEDP